MKYKARMNGK